MVNEVLSHERPFSFPIRETLRPFDSARSTQNLSGTIQAATVETTEISTQTDNMDSLNRIYSLINPVIQAHGIDHVLWRMRRFLNEAMSWSEDSSEYSSEDNFAEAINLEDTSFGRYGWKSQIYRVPLLGDTGGSDKGNGIYGALSSN